VTLFFSGSAPFARSVVASATPVEPFTPDATTDRDRMTDLDYLLVHAWLRRPSHVRFLVSDRGQFVDHECYSFALTAVDRV
jgi:hypothetical protein